VLIAQPSNFAMWQVKGVDFAPNGNLRTLYLDNGSLYRVVGHPDNLEQLGGVSEVSVPAGQSFLDIQGIAIASTSWVYTFFESRMVSAGTSVDLDAYVAPYAYKTPGHCDTAATVHEIGHALGLRHEHTRCDRDDFVRVYWYTVKEGKEQRGILRGPGEAGRHRLGERTLHTWRRDRCLAPPRSLTNEGGIAAGPIVVVLGSGGASAEHVPLVQAVVVFVLAQKRSRLDRGCRIPAGHLVQIQRQVCAHSSRSLDMPHRRIPAHMPRSISWVPASSASDRGSCSPGGRSRKNRSWSTVRSRSRAAS
jgi:hypothetical protein